VNLLRILGKRIQSVREKRGLTQEALEERTGINTKYISAIECGHKNVTIMTLEKIAKGLDIELYELILLSAEPGTEKAAKKTIESLLEDADAKTLKLCLAFLRKGWE